jgi:hypothetical protein
VVSKEAAAVVVGGGGGGGGGGEGKAFFREKNGKWVDVRRPEGPGKTELPNDKGSNPGSLSAVEKVAGMHAIGSRFKVGPILQQARSVRDMLRHNCHTVRQKAAWTSALEEDQSHGLSKFPPENEKLKAKIEIHNSWLNLKCGFVHPALLSASVSALAANVCPIHTP